LAIELGVGSFVELTPDPVTGALLPAAERVRRLLEEVERAEHVGLHSFGIGEHHRADYVSSAPTVLLGAAAARTRRIRLASAVSVLSSEDPVRLFQQFATVDLIANGRAEIMVGRGSFIESFPLFGLSLDDYDALFAEKLDLLLRIRAGNPVRWSGRFRPALTGQSIYPRPVQDPLPIWLGVGGTPGSFARAGLLGLPLMLGIIGGEFHRFRPLVDLYRESWRRAGHPAEALRVGVHTIGFLADSSEQAADEVFPAYAQQFSRIGSERGWPPVTRAQFDAGRSPRGSLVVGSAQAVAEKILAMDAALGGLDRFEIQLTPGTMPQEKVLHAIDLLGTQVAPAVAAARGMPPR
jgi:probable LLM family oxidoreductase